MSKSKAERKSDREFVVSRIINGPARLVFEAWTKPELFQKWWIPKGAPMTIVSCEMDVRTGGTYRLGIKMGEQVMSFFGNYREVTPHSRLVWTNEEGGPENAAITTATFDAQGEKTLVTVTDLYPSKKALDEAIASGSTDGMPVQLDQLDEFVNR
ncbi:MAG: SRPBCC family protein [Archangium sp.]